MDSPEKFVGCTKGMAFTYDGASLLSTKAFDHWHTEQHLESNVSKAQTGEYLFMR
jgi:hypothetical protein